MMPVPAVSPRNWQRTAIICSFRMGTGPRMAGELSFQDQLLTVLENEESYREQAIEIEGENRTSSKFTTHTDFDATPDNPHRVSLRITRTEPHRPDIDGAVVAQLHKAVKDEKPSVPAEKFDFDTNLGIVLDAAERYYNALQCEIA
jgi:hypothetical protein